MFRKRPPGYRTELIERFDSRFKDLWESVDKKDMIIGLRDPDYLNWRYASHPEIKYRIFTIVHGRNLSGYIVFHSNADTCHIDDLFGASEDIDSLISHFTCYIRKNKISQEVVFYNNENSLMKLRLKRYGFFKRHDHMDFMVYAKDSDNSFSSDGRNWFLTAGDKDI